MSANRFEATEPSVVIQLARQGLGVGVVPRPQLPVEARLLTITRPELLSPIALAWQAEGPASPAARAFLRRAHATLLPLAASPTDTPANPAQSSPTKPTDRIAPHLRRRTIPGISELTRQPDMSGRPLDGRLGRKIPPAT